jgi:small-conductance mechanosensitive channel
MNRLINISFGTLFLLSSSIALACDYPERPSIPDGSAASKDELLAAKNSIQDFMAKVDEYLNCIEGEEKAAVEEMDNPSEEILQRRDEMLNKKFDAANEEKALLGEQFNQQIRAYNKKLQESKE